MGEVYIKDGKVYEKPSTFREITENMFNGDKQIGTLREGEKEWHHNEAPIDIIDGSGEVIGKISPRNSLDYKLDNPKDVELDGEHGYLKTDPSLWDSITGNNLYDGQLMVKRNRKDDERQSQSELEETVESGQSHQDSISDSTSYDTSQYSTPVRKVPKHKRTPDHNTKTREGAVLSKVIEGMGLSPEEEYNLKRKRGLIDNPDEDDGFIDHPDFGSISDKEQAALILIQSFFPEKYQKMLDSARSGKKVIIAC